MSVIGAADDAAEAVRKAEKSARREQRSRAADVEMGAEADAAVAVAPAAAAPPEAAETGALRAHGTAVQQECIDKGRLLNGKASLGSGTVLFMRNMQYF